MNKKETILVVGAFLFAVGGALGVFVLTKDSAEDKAASSEHTDEHGDYKQTEQKNNAPEVDLTNQSQVHMEMNGYAYAKPNIKIKRGTTVTWTNQDNTMEHNVMQEHERSDHAHDAPTKEEVKPDVFAGPLLAKGESYSFTFHETGSISYHCAPHPSMTGTITVVD